MSTKLVARRVRATYEFIKTHRTHYRVQTMCRVLGVAPSGYYAWLQRPLSRHAQEDARLLRWIRAAFLASHSIYGVPRVFLELREAGETCSKHRGARLMRVNHLRFLHPLSVVTLRRLGSALLYRRRYPEAREVVDRGLALAPADLSLIEHKAMTFLVEGDLAGTRAVLKAAPKDVEPTSLVAYVANYYDLVWVLDEEQRELLLHLTPSAFDNDKATWAVCLAEAYALRGNAASLRKYAELARSAIEEQLRGTPNDPQRHVFLGLMLAYLGRKEEALREGLRGLALLPAAKDALSGVYYEHQLVRINMLVGEPEKALDQLEPLLKTAYYLSPGWLKIDPNFDPLRKNPRFQKLVAGK